jgi:hypothetical protein
MGHRVIHHKGTCQQAHRACDKPTYTITFVSRDIADIAFSFKATYGSPHRAHCKLELSCPLQGTNCVPTGTYQNKASPAE